MTGDFGERVVLRETLLEPRFNFGWASVCGFGIGVLLLGEVLTAMNANVFERAALILLALLAMGSSLFGLWFFFSAQLKIDRTGFVFRRCGRSWRRDWSQCQHFGSQKRLGGEVLQVNYNADVQAISLLSRRLVSNDTLDVSFGLGARQLAYLLDRYRARMEIEHVCRR